MRHKLNLATSDQNLKFEDNPLDYYLSLEYLVAVYPEDDGFSVMIPDLPGCMSQGKTLDEAMDNIDKAKRLWLSVVYVKDKTLIPLPSNQNK